MNTTTKILISLVAITGILGLTIVILRFSSPEDTWICSDQGWIKHGNPSNAMPTSGCDNDNKNPITSTNNQYANDIVVDIPHTNQEISSPFTITGKARGTWYFEGSFPIQLFDNQGNKLADSYAMSQGEWMTTEFVPFTSTLTFDIGEATSGILVIKNDNPSDNRTLDKEIRIPLLFKQETTQVLVFFNNIERDPGLVDCSVVYGVSRTIKKTQAIGRATLEQLFKGISKEEESEGFVDNIPAGVTIQKLTIENGVAKVDLSKELEQGVGGSCRVTAIRAQITETLKQFPTVSE